MRRGRKVRIRLGSRVNAPRQLRSMADMIRMANQIWMLKPHDRASNP